MIYTCHCCGGPANDKKQDPNRDKGFGTCDRCRAWIDERNEEEYQKLVSKVRSALNPINRTRFDLMDAELQRGIIGKMIDQGLITWEVVR